MSAKTEEEYEVSVLSEKVNTEDVKVKPEIEVRSGWSKIFSEFLVPVALIGLIPNLTVCLLFLVTQWKSHSSLIFSQGVYDFWLSSWRATCPNDAYPWLIVLAFGLWAAISVLIPVGKVYRGPLTRAGFQPTYRNNGFHYYVVTCLLTAVLIGTGVVPAAAWYRRLPELAGVLNLFGLGVCAFLLIKGHLRPSPGEHGTSGNAIFDFYWGMELYPRIGKYFDLKMWTNCRFGMMLWQLVVLLAWTANYELSGFSWAATATALLQTVYIAKFYWWEAGYMASVDIIVDRAGFYICWGCIFYVPTFYTMTSIYMVEQAPHYYGPIHFALNVVFGLLMIGFNYWADQQRQVCGETQGQCKIWGRPARIIKAQYTLEDGSVKERILLASGFWAISRHSNYLFEILGALSWSLPALFHSLIPYLYVLFLIILLVHRSFRDEKKCRAKYGPYWVEYSRISKYQLIPYVF